MRVSDNRERLNKNKQEVQKQILDVLGGRLDRLDVDVVVSSWFSQDPVSVAIDQFNIEALSYFADQLEVKRDADRNIHRYKTVLSDGTASVVRDARNATSVSLDVANLDPNSIRMLMIGATRAGLFILDHVGQTGDVRIAKDQLYVLFNEAMKEAASAHTKAEIKGFIESYNAKVKDIMIKNGIDKLPGIALDKDLTYAYNATNIHNHHSHISTVSEFEGRIIIESDIMALGVTDKQRETIGVIKSGANSIGELWFDDASPIRRAMILDVVNNLIDQDGKVQKVMPTQLRNLMPFVKNAYVKFTSVIDGEKVVDVAENLHCGAIYLELKEDNNESIKSGLTEMAQQVASFAPAQNIAVNQVNSTSPWNLAAKAEAEANKQSQEAMYRTGNDACNTPFNMLHLGPRDAGGYARTLNNMSEILLRYSKDIAQYDGAMSRQFQVIGEWIKIGEPKSLLGSVGNMMWGSSVNKEYGIAKNYLGDLEQSIMPCSRETQAELMQVMRAAIEAKHLLTYQMTSKTNHDNVTLFECFSSINAAVHNPDGAFAKFFGSKAGIADMLRNIPYLSFNCMSGKDRTGVAMFDSAVQAVGDFIAAKVQASEMKVGNIRREDESLFIPPTDREVASAAAWKENGGIAKKKELASVINAHEHTQLIPSQNNIGTHGVKSDSESAQTLEVFAGNVLTRATASFNKLKYAKGVEFDVSHPIFDRKSIIKGQSQVPEQSVNNDVSRSGSFAVRVEAKGKTGSNEIA